MRKHLVQLLAGVILFASQFTTPAYCHARTDYANVQGTIMYVTPDVSQDNINAETDNYNKLDPGIRQALANIGIKHYIINEKNDNTYSGHTGNTIFWGEGNSMWTYTTPLSTIYTEGRMSKDIKYGGTVMNHEIGHVVDSIYQVDNYYNRVFAQQSGFGASITPEWQGLYKKYKNTIAGFGGLSKYEVYNASEAFAESYAHYARDPEMVRKNCPEIAAYIDMVNKDVVARFAPEYLVAKAN